MTGMLEAYRSKYHPALMKELGLSNPMQAPKLEKIVISMGVGKASADKKKIEAPLAELAVIAGQKPVTTRARKSIAGFSLREGQVIGCKVTLRGERMYDFLHRLITIVLPRGRDFRGLSFKAFDGRGNYNFGLKEQIVFPEVDYDKVDETRGMNITIVTSSESDQHAEALLRQFGFPLKRRAEGK